MEPERFFSVTFIGKRRGSRKGGANSQPIFDFRKISLRETKAGRRGGGVITKGKPEGVGGL